MFRGVRFLLYGVTDIILALSNLRSAFRFLSWGFQDGLSSQGCSAYQSLSRPRSRTLPSSILAVWWLWPLPSTGRTLSCFPQFAVFALIWSGCCSCWWWNCFSLSLPFFSYCLGTPSPNSSAVPWSLPKIADPAVSEFACRSERWICLTSILSWLSFSICQSRISWVLVWGFGPLQVSSQGRGCNSTNSWIGCAKSFWTLREIVI